MREEVYWRGSLSDIGFYGRVGEFSERRGGLSSKRWTYGSKREIFSKRSLCQRGMGLIRERRVVRQGSLLEKERGKFVGEGWHF